MQIKPAAARARHIGLVQTTAIRSHPTEPGLGEALLRQFEDTSHYRCYPDVDRFIEAFGPAQYRQALQQRAHLGALAGTPLALHVRIPACLRGERHPRRALGDAAAYCEALEAEMALQVQGLDGRPGVTGLHLGGAPGWLDDAALERLLQQLHRHFTFAPQAECSVALEPGDTTSPRLAHLAGHGFRRVDFELHDYDPASQPVLQCLQLLEQTGRLVAAARVLGYTSIGIELTRDRPLQSPATFTAILEQALRLEPDRILLQPYRPPVHLAALPGPRSAVLHGRAIELLRGRGYRHLGLGCHAVSGDALAVAKRHGRLQRKLLGYSAQPDGDLIGLGVAAIGQIGATYSQNAPTLDAYRAALRSAELPVARGLALTREDLLRRSVIHALLCQGRLDFEALALAHLIDFRRHFATEIEQLQRHADLGLVEIDADGLEVTALGCHVVGAIASVFDAYRQTDRERARCSGRL